MNKKDFVKWLEQFDDDVVIQVGVQQPPHCYQSFGDVFQEDFIDQYDYVNFNGNQFVKPESPLYGKKFLMLGERT